jgi:hypothetical protein
MAGAVFDIQMAGRQMAESRLFLRVRTTTGFA